MRRYRISGRRKLNGQEFTLARITNKRDAERFAKALRGGMYLPTSDPLRTVRVKPFNARVVPLKSQGGYGIYVAKSKRPRTFNRIPRDYNRLLIKWRRFTDPNFGIDTGELANWLRLQDGYNNNLSWQENLKRLAGQDAFDELLELTDPETAVKERMIGQAANIATAMQIDQLLADEIGSGFGNANVLPAPDLDMLGEQTIDSLMRTDDMFSLAKPDDIFRDEQQLRDEFGTGLDMDALVMDDGTLKNPEDVSIFDLLGIDDNEEEYDDSALLEGLDNWFKNELYDGKDILPEKVGETSDKIKQGLAIIVNENAQKKEGNSLEQELDSILYESFRSDIFEGAGTDDTVVFGNLELNMQDFMSDRERNPNLGFFQPEVPEELPSGYWTFRPLGDAAKTRQKFDTKNAFLVVDSLGSVITGSFYDDDDGADVLRALRASYDIAKQTSRNEVYSSTGYEEYTAQLAPGVAVIDAKITVDNDGNWAGYDIDRRDDAYSLEAGNYRYFLDGKEFNPAEGDYINPNTLRNWILPQRIGVEQPNRKTAEFLNVDFEAADTQARMVLAEIQRNKGASAEQVLDVIQNNTYKVKNSFGEPVSTVVPDYRTALKVIEEQKNNFENVNGYQIFSIPLENGRSMTGKEELVANIRQVGDEVLFSFTGVR
tara:strand:+ start:5398 stop:7368 length:1971 start_codon:yes stop_codon:yes gene_type:complete